MGALTFDKLEAMTCVCSVGLDMIAVPGDTSPETIAAIIADEAAIGMINRKTTAVRIIPAPGRKVGDMVEFGGLLGSAMLLVAAAVGWRPLVERVPFRAWSVAIALLSCAGYLWTGRLLGAQRRADGYMALATFGLPLLAAIPALGGGPGRAGSLVVSAIGCALVASVWHELD